MQGVQGLLPVAEKLVPNVQGTGAAVDWHVEPVHTKPDAQEQLVWPVRVPATPPLAAEGQLRQATVPAVAVYLFAAHSEHVVFLDVEQRPEAPHPAAHWEQGEHEVAPARANVEPATQAVHVVLDVGVQGAVSALPLAQLAVQLAQGATPEADQVAPATQAACSWRGARGAAGPTRAAEEERAARRSSRLAVAGAIGGWVLGAWKGGDAM